MERSEIVLHGHRVAHRLDGRGPLLVPKPEGDCSLGACANAVRDLPEARGRGVAMPLAYQYPERCERLVLVSSGGLGRDLGARDPLIPVRHAHEAHERIAGSHLRAGPAPC